MRGRVVCVARTTSEEKGKAFERQRTVYVPKKIVLSFIMTSSRYPIPTENRLALSYQSVGGLTRENGMERTILPQKLGRESKMVRAEL